MPHIPGHLEEEPIVPPAAVLPPEIGETGAAFFPGFETILSTAATIGGELLGGDDEEGGIRTETALTPEQQAVMSSLFNVIQERLARPVSFAAEEALERALIGVSPAEAERQFRELQLPRLQRIFQEEVDPRVSEAFVQSGLRGTPRAQARARAAQQFGEFTSAQLAEEIRRGQELGLRALAAAPAIQALPLQTGLEFARVPALLAQPRPVETGFLGGLGRELGRFDFSQFFPETPFSEVGVGRAADIIESAVRG